MQFVKKCVYIVCILFFPLFCHSQSVTYKKGMHVPLIFIMEQDDNETLSMYRLGPDTRDLNIGILERNAPILVSRAIFYNFIDRRQNWNDPNHRENQLLKDTSIPNEEWELYVPINTHYFAHDNQLYLLLPKTKKNLFTSAVFNVNSLKKLDILPTQESNDYTQLLELLKPTIKDIPEKEKIISKETVKEISHDLKKIFATILPPSKDERSLPIHRQEAWEGPIWDIYFSGHGSPKPDPVIANLTPIEMQELLTFFNNYMRIGVLIIASCYLGGENLSSIKFKDDINNDKIFFPLDFIIIVNSVGDIPTSFFTNKSFFANIFDIAQNLENTTHHSLQNLLSILGEINKTSQDIHAQTNIPQIILPGGIEIQSFTSSNNVMVLGKVKVRTAELENRPIQVYPKKLHDDPKFDYVLNVLVYPPIINVPLIVRSSHLPLDVNLRELAKRQWENLPTFSDIITRNEKFFDEEKQQSIFTKKIDSALLKDNQYLYPNIISMTHGNASQYLSKIVVEGDAFKGSGGIFMAFRDAFCNLTERPTLKTFYIETLEGPNDISLILKAARAIANNPHEKPLEKELPGDGEHVVLYNVSIETQDEYGMVVIVRFQINKTAWEYKYEAFHWEAADIFKPQWWNFKPINASEYEKKFKELKSRIMRSNKPLRLKKKQKSLTSIFEKPLSEQQKAYEAIQEITQLREKTIQEK